MSILSVIGLMAIAGIAGGIINYALARGEKFSREDLFWAIAVGLGASFLVPLFLNTISSSLLTRVLEPESSAADVFVYFGFCLLGAIASKVMIQSLTQKALNLAKEAKEGVDELEKEVTPIIVRQTEPEEGGPRVSPATAEGFALAGSEAPEVIKALGTSRYSRRTVSGIAQDSGVPRKKVIETLSWLAENELVIDTHGRDKRYWSLTEQGYGAFEELVHQGLE